MARRKPEALPPLPRRPRDAHKGECGRVLVIAGSRGMLGAGCLAAEAALRTGAGLVTLAVPEGLLLPASVKLTEVILAGVPEGRAGAFSAAALAPLTRLAGGADVVLLGPGLSRDPEARAIARDLYRNVTRRMVVDADGLDALAGDPEGIIRHAGERILTPHPGEMARLTGSTAARIRRARQETAVRAARRWRTVVILKGAGTVVTDGKKGSVNTTGNPGMATAGTGDVLAGVVAGLWAQGMEALAAARLAAHLHGAAGDLASARLGEHSLLAGDLLGFLPEAFLAHG